MTMVWPLVVKLKQIEIIMHFISLRLHRGQMFSKKTLLQKLFNRYTQKLSYCCVPNMKSFFASHNKTVLSNYTSTPAAAISINSSSSTDFGSDLSDSSNLFVESSKSFIKAPLFLTRHEINLALPESMLERLVH